MLYHHGRSLYFIWMLLFSFSIGLFYAADHLGVESFSLRSLTPRSHPTRSVALYSKNDHTLEGTKNNKDSPLQHGSIQEAKNLFLTAGLVAALSITTPFGIVVPVAKAASSITETTASVGRLSTMTAVSSSSLSLATSSATAVALPSDSSSSTVAPTAMLPSIAQSGMPKVASIMDLAGVLDPKQDVPDLVHAIQQAEQTTGTELQIVTVNQVQKGYTPKRMATTLFNQWRLGTSAKNNGVLILVVLDERRTEIEVGMALNQAMNAQWCTRILKENASPAFRQEDYGKGLLATVEKVSERLQEVDRGVTPRYQLDTEAFANAAGLSVVVGVVGSVYFEMKYPIKKDCPQCQADWDTWTFPTGWVVSKEATDEEEGMEEIEGVCANCGHVYTETKTIRKYDGSTVDSDGNVSYYYDSDSDSGGSSDGGGGGDSW